MYAWNCPAWFSGENSKSNKKVIQTWANAEVMGVILCLKTLKQIEVISLCFTAPIQCLLVLPAQWSAVLKERTLEDNREPWQNMWGVLFKCSVKTSWGSPKSCSSFPEPPCPCLWLVLLTEPPLYRPVLHQAFLSLLCWQRLPPGPISLLCLHCMSPQQDLGMMVGIEVAQRFKGGECRKHISYIHYF